MSKFYNELIFFDETHHAVAFQACFQLTTPEHPQRDSIRNISPTTREDKEYKVS